MPTEIQRRPAERRPAERRPAERGAARLPMDPRIRQRRVEWQRASGRRRLRLLLAGMAMMASIGGALALLHSPILRVRHLVVTGAVHVSKARVAEVAGVGSATPMVDVNPVRIEASLERLAWVRMAAVTRHWPGTLTVRVVERSPVAQVRTADDSWAELDITGKVLDSSRTRWPGLVALVGYGTGGAPGSVLDKARPGLKVAAAMPVSVLPHVTGVLSDPGGQVSLQVSTGVTVALGAPTDLGAKMSSLATMLAQVDMAGAKTIDIQVPEAPTLTRG
ncbi:MAG: cell division protein FtsQ/DivIB [Acidimicrobiales bacterium]